MTDTLYIGKGEQDQALRLNYANRHGLIAGATGTGKTVTLQRLAEGFARAGVPVFVADVKGDLSGLSQAGVATNTRVQERLAKIGYNDLHFAAAPTVFWDVFGKLGHPVRVTVSEMGPVLLGRLLDLSDAQEGVLTLTFKVADDRGLLLLDLKDLQAMLQEVAASADTLQTTYGNISSATIGGIQRRLLQFEQEGIAKLFGEPALNIQDLLRVGQDGQGYINILAAETLINSGKVYATLLLWLLSELYETLPEAGDLPKPKLVFFFDEAHLLFNDAPKALVDKVEQVVRLIRSKGVGIYFVTQNPADIPDDILGQLGNRVQHALRAFTPKDQKAVRAAAESFRPNPAFKTEEVITTLGVGEALVSLLDSSGTPGIVDRTLICPPGSQIGAVSIQQRQQILQQSPVTGVYERQIDRESAYEKLTQKVAAQQPQAVVVAQQQQEMPQKRVASGGSGGGYQRQSASEAMVKSVIRTVGNEVGRQLIRGLLGALRK